MKDILSGLIAYQERGGQTLIVAQITNWECNPGYCEQVQRSHAYAMTKQLQSDRSCLVIA